MISTNIGDFHYSAKARIRQLRKIDEIQGKKADDPHMK